MSDLRANSIPFISQTLLVVLSVDLLATAGDITMTWSSPMYPKLYSNDTSINPLGAPITRDEDAWLGSLINIGAIIGPLPFGYISEKFGRKVALLSIAIPHFIAYVTMAFSKSIYLFYFGRIIGGMAEGAGYAILPMYIAEVSENSRRGMYSLTLGIFWSIGNFIPYVVGPFMSIMSFHILLACFPLIFFVVFFVVGVETPYYLAAANRLVEAEKTLMRLRSCTKKEAEIELHQIVLTLENEQQGTLIDIVKDPSSRKSLIIVITLIVFQQTSGSNAISFYLQSIFEDSGDKISSNIASLVVGICTLVFSFVAPCVVDKFGRKPLHIASAFGCTVCTAIFGAYFFITNNTKINIEGLFWLPLFMLIMNTFSFQIGLSVIPWTISSELFPKNVKHISAVVVSMACWISSFMVTKFFNDMCTFLGMAGVFWFFSTQTLLDGFFTIFFVQETKGKSFLEIQNLLRREISFISNEQFK